MGLPLALGTWAGLVLTAVIILAIYIFRITFEEKALVEAYGKEYKDYMKKKLEAHSFGLLMQLAGIGPASRAVSAEEVRNRPGSAWEARVLPLN